MTPTFKKLNFKTQKEICIVNSPSEFAQELKAMKIFTSIKTDIKECKDIEFILTFVKTKDEIDKITRAVEKKLKGDGIVWFAYPKGSSKKYNVEISRDNGWDILGEIGLEGVRAVAIDDDWSALRFRRVEYIKVMNRNSNSAMTQNGKTKTKATLTTKK